MKQWLGIVFFSVVLLGCTGEDEEAALACGFSASDLETTGASYWDCFRSDGLDVAYNLVFAFNADGSAAEVEFNKAGNLQLSRPSWEWAVESTACLVRVGPQGSNGAIDLRITEITGFVAKSSFTGMIAGYENGIAATTPASYQCSYIY